MSSPDLFDVKLDRRLFGRDRVMATGQPLRTAGYFGLGCAL